MNTYYARIYAIRDRRDLCIPHPYDPKYPYRIEVLVDGIWHDVPGSGTSTKSSSENRIAKGYDRFSDPTDIQRSCKLKPYDIAEVEL